MTDIYIQSSDGGKTDEYAAEEHVAGAVNV